MTREVKAFDGLSVALADAGKAMGRRLEADMFGPVTTEHKITAELSPISSSDLEFVKSLFRHPLFTTELKEFIDDRLIKLDDTKQERMNKRIQVCRFANVLHKIKEQKVEPLSFTDLLAGL